MKTTQRNYYIIRDGNGALYDRTGRARYTNEVKTVEDPATKKQKRVSVLVPVGLAEIASSRGFKFRKLSKARAFQRTLHKSASIEKITILVDIPQQNVPHVSPEGEMNWMMRFAKANTRMQGSIRNSNRH